MEVNYRLFELSDIQLYLDWVNQKEIWEVDNSGEFEYRTKESFSEQWKSIVGWKRSWFIEVEGKKIGYIGFVSDENNKLTNEFFIVLGETNQWGHGYGKKAMNWLFMTAKELGLNSLTGQVLGNNIRALSFYNRLGFSKIGEREPTFQRNGQTFKTILIEKDL